MNISSFSWLPAAMPLLWSGFITTMGLWVTAVAIALTLGCAIGLIRSSRLRIPILSSILDEITAVLRAIPFYVQLLIAYFVLPELCGIAPGAGSVAIITLGLCSAAYVSQIVQGGCQIIAPVQWETALTLGYSTGQTIRYIIFPQLIRIIIPGISGEVDQLLKSTAIASTIGVLELTGVAKNIVARELNPLPVYGTIAVLYGMLSLLLWGIVYAITKKDAKW